MGGKFNCSKGKVKLSYFSYTHNIFDSDDSESEGSGYLCCNLLAFISALLIQEEQPDVVVKLLSNFFRDNSDYNYGHIKYW